MMDDGLKDLLSNKVQRIFTKLDRIESYIIEQLSPIDSLDKKEILNLFILKVILSQRLEKKYRDIVFNLFYIAISYSPEKSFVILTLEKVLQIMSNLSKDDIKLLSLRGIQEIDNIDNIELKILCNKVNDINQRELTKPPTVTRSHKIKLMTNIETD